MFTIEGEQENDFQPGSIINVEITRQEGEGFGFNIIGGKDSTEVPNDNGIFISQINRGGPAYNTRILDVGDRILEVNGSSLDNVDHNIAVNAFRNSGNAINIKVEKYGQQIVAANNHPPDVPDGPAKPSFTQKSKTFFNSWPGAILIGLTAGIITTLIITKMRKYK